MFDIVKGVRDVLENISGKVSEATNAAFEETENKIVNRNKENTVSKSYNIVDNDTGASNRVKVFYDTDSGDAVGAMEFFEDGSSKAYSSPESLDRYFNKIKSMPKITIYDSPVPLSTLQPVPEGYIEDEYNEKATSYYDYGLGEWDPRSVFNLNYQPAYNFGTRSARRFNKTEGESKDYAKQLRDWLMEYAARQGDRYITSVENYGEGQA